MSEIKNNSEFSLTGAECGSKMEGMTIKQAIQKELKRRGWSRYRLVKELEGKMPPRTVYSFLAGVQDLTTERASIILKELGLKIKR
jgi:hypothetical protein